MHSWKILLVVIWCIGIIIGLYGLFNMNGFIMLLGGVNSLLATHVGYNIKTVCLECGKEIYL